MFQELEEEYGREQVHEVDVDEEARASSPDMPGALGMAGFGSDRYIILYQPVGDPAKKTFRPSVIQKSHEEKKVGLRNKGKRVFYRETELPSGWKLENPADSYKYKCPQEGCPKKLATARALRNHVMGFHERNWDGLYKDPINKLVAKEMEADGVFDAMVIGAA